MGDGVVIDANIIPDFYREYRVKFGVTYDAVIWIKDNIGIAINAQIATEWKQVCSADVFITWYTDQLKLGTIRNIECRNLPKHIVKRMVQDYGFPGNTLDIHYIKCAYNTDKTKYIITLNYDFYEPSCRKSSIRERNRAREKREGRFCQFLKKRFLIRVGLPEHCKKDFGIP
jgi:hypothetical protein